MKTVRQDKTYYFQCDCSSQEHTFGVQFDLEEKEVSFHIQLAQHNSFFARVWNALKYIFGYQCKWGHWDVTIMREETFMDLYNMMSRYIYTAGFTNKGAKKIQKALNEIKKGSSNSVVPQGTHYTKNVTSKYKKS